MKYIYTLAIITFLASCGDSISDKAYMIESETKLSFDIKKDVSIASRSFRHLEDDGNEYIAFTTQHYNKKYDEIVFYNLKQSEESHRIKITKRGENSIHDEAKHFDIISKDTIVLFNLSEPSVYFANSNGEIFYKHKCRTPKLSPNILVSIIDAPFVMINDSIFEFPQEVPYTRLPLAPNPKDFSFSDCPLAYWVNTKTGEEKPSEVAFPKLYENDGNIGHRESYSRIYDGKNFIYGFLTYDSLIVTSDHQTAKTYCAKSKYIGNIKNPGTPPGASIPDRMKTTLLAQYGNLIYDPYREVYYRFCYFENDYPGPYTLEYTISGGAFTIMIIDKEFNVIGETVFPDKRYASKIFFVNKDGLWLSENHFLREDMTDDKLVFRCLKLEYF